MRTPRLCLCFFLFSCMLTLCLANVKLSSSSHLNKDGLSSSTVQIKKSVEDKAKLDVVLFQQPNKEVQCKPFRVQPKLFVNNSFENVNRNESQWGYYVVATLKQEVEMNRSLEGTESVEFVNNWANFTNLAISHFGHGYWLEFSIFSSDNDSSLSTEKSLPFDVAEYPFYVTSSVKPAAHMSAEFFSVDVVLSIFDFTTNSLAHPNSLNDTVWNYSINLRQNGSSSESLAALNGSFPLRSSRTQELEFNVTSFGYRYEFDIAIHSPSFTTREKTTSDPFDLLKKIPSEHRCSTIALTFNGSSKDISGFEDTFCTVFLNHFGRRHNEVLWMNYTERKSKELVVQVTLVGKSDDVDETLQGVRSDVKGSHVMKFKDMAFMLQNKLEITEQSNSTEALSGIGLVFGLQITSVFTIALMSFLCSAFVVLVIIWRIREKKILESYNRRIKTRPRPNGHVNTAFDSNESVPEKNIYYMAVNGRHAKENGYHPDRESRIRRCSSGGFHRSYRRMRRMGSDDGDTYLAANGAPLDDDIIYPDPEKQDEVFRDVYFSPTSEGLPTFASSSSSFHDEYLLKDVHAHSGRANYAHIPMHKYKGSKRKCSVTASTVSGSLNSLATSRSVSRMLSNSTIDSYSLHRPPVGWSSHDDNKLCNGNRGLNYANPAIG